MFGSTPGDGAPVEEPPERAAVFGTGRIRLGRARLLDISGDETLTSGTVTPSGYCSITRSAIRTLTKTAISRYPFSVVAWTLLAAFLPVHCGSAMGTPKRGLSK